MRASMASAYAGAWVLELGNKRISSDAWSAINNTAYDISASGLQDTKHVSLAIRGRLGWSHNLHVHGLGGV